MNQNEFGIDINFNVNFDMSARTGLSLVITKPSGAALTKTPTLGIVTLGTFLANKYVTYRTIAGDIDEAGTYSMRLTYTDALPSQLLSDIKTFEVNP